jgi:starch synthase
VTVVTPRYRGVAGGREVAAFREGAWTGARACRVLERRHQDGVRFRMIDCPAFFDRDGIYGDGAGDFPDNHMRYALLSRVALETAAALGERPSVLHAHDWQAGLLPVYLRHRLPGHAAFQSAGVVFTIHNLAYQGLFPRDVLPGIDVPWSVFTSDGLEFWEQASYLKAGINFSHVVTTVSERYAEEIQTPEQGFGFEGVLQQRRAVLVGIRNGIDVTAWNPMTDPWLPAKYSCSNLTGKALVKRALLERFGMTSPAQLARPVVGMVSRMVDQKGLDLIAAAAASGELLSLDATFVILGTGTPRYEDMWRRLAASHRDRVAATVGFSEELAHLIEGGADMFLMPSRFEPCGLNQMYSLRYGTVPVVRATGGLDDTVAPVDDLTGEGNGFSFRPYTTAAMMAALRQALSWFASPEAWRRIQVAGMRQDNSWDASARAYTAVYERAARLAAEKSSPGT